MLALLLAAVTYTTTDSTVLRNISYFGVMIGASIAAWIGAQRAPRGQRLIPRLIAAGITATALGDLLWEAVDRFSAYSDVSVADVPWFASYAFLITALWITLSRSRGIDLDYVLDAITIVTVSVLIFWTLSVDAIVADTTVSPFVRLVWASYPVADAVLLALVLRMLLSRRARASIDGWFAFGVLCWLAADIAYLQSPTNETVLLLMDLAWMLAPAFLARAAWRRWPEVNPAEVSDEPPGAVMWGSC